LSEEWKAELELSCKPRFLIFIEGEMKADIIGADFTKIEQVVNTYIPSLED